MMEHFSGVRGIPGQKGNMTGPFPLIAKLTIGKANQNTLKIFFRSAGAIGTYSFDGKQIETVCCSFYLLSAQGIQALFSPMKD